MRSRRCLRRRRLAGVGSRDVEALVRSDGHRALVDSGCCHFLGPAVVTVRDDDTVAVCESLVVLRAADGYPERERAATAAGLPAPGYVVWRAAANHFRLRRIEGRWQITTRTSRVLDGNPPHTNCCPPALKGADFGGEPGRSC